MSYDKFVMYSLSEEKGCYKKMHHKFVSNWLCKPWNVSDFSDVTFEVDGGTIAGHKAILMVRSDMMACMFTNNFMESSAKLVGVYDRSTGWPKENNTETNQNNTDTNDIFGY